MTFDFLERPLIAGRVASLPVTVATELLDDPDPIEAAREYLRHNAFARAAIAVASPSLATAVDDWLAGKPLRNSRTPLRALSYLVRMATRTTPFGLFAGVGAIDTGESTNLALDAARYRTHTRPDMEIVSQAAAERSASSSRYDLCIVTNDCAFVRGDRLHVTNIALANLTDSGTEQRDVSLRHTKAVAFIRAFCANGASYRATIEALCSEFSAPQAEAERLLDRLEEAGVVISELRVSPIGDPIARLAVRLDETHAPRASALRDAIDAMASHDKVSPFAQTAEDVATLRSTVARVVPEPPQDVMQVDLHAGFSGTLGSGVLQDVATLGLLLMRSNPPSRLEDYRRRFRERYEGSERMVPLLELVDNEYGLGFPEALRRDSAFDEARTVAIMQLFSDAMREGVEEIDLRSGAIDTILPIANSGRLPTALEIGFHIEATSAEAVSRNEYRLIGSMLLERPCGVAGRFGAMLGDEFIDRMRAFARRCERSGEVTAELAYAPVSSRGYNICVRPRIYEHEVSAGIGAPAGPGSISPSDLYVGIEDERFFLWSKSLRSRVDVRETHAMTTIKGAPNLCRFLALLYQDNLRVPGVDFGPAEKLTYLPRIVHGRVVIAGQRWQFARSTFGETERDAAHAFQRLRERWNLPRYLYLSEKDNRLMIDLDSSIAPAMIQAHASDASLKFTEVLPAPDRTWVPGPSGAHAVEFVAEAVLVPSDAAPAPRLEPTFVEHRPVHGPGSRWCYVKLYLGPQNADDFVATQLSPLAKALRAEGTIDRWFFLRYADPGFHLRFRVRAATEEVAPLMRERVLATAERWLQEARIWRSALDTYDPEYERYGGREQIDRAEHFFYYDSELCAAILSEGIADTGARIEAAVATLDASIRASERASRLVLEMYAAAAKQKIGQRDRDSLRRIGAEPAACVPFDLDAALEGDLPGRRIGAYVHMHCNRLGLDAEAETRACVLLRALALSRKSRVVTVV